MQHLENLSDFVAHTFKAYGISCVFIYPGGTIAPLVNSILKYGIKTEVFKSEQGAFYAGLALARVTRKPQVVLVTSGPGVTNAITPLADAFYDSTPLVLITGQVGTADLKNRKAVRQRGFQEVPTVELTRPLSKRSTCMMSADDVFMEVPLAFEIAKSGRSGPVTIDFPMDIQRQRITSETTPKAVISPVEQTKDRIDQDVVKEIAAGVMAARRPVLLLGQGALNASMYKEYLAISHAVDARVVTSFLGIGSYDTSDPRWLGYIGHTGHLTANRAVFESDFLIVLGSRLDVRQTGTVLDQFVRQGHIAWIDIDPTELSNPRVNVTWALEADIRIFCSSLLVELGKRFNPIDVAWKNDLNALKAEQYEDRPRVGSNYVQPRTFLESLARLVRDIPTTVVTGVGCHQHWAARHLPYHPQWCRLLTSGGHGTMGYDLPSAIGASIAEPERRVVCIVGDGSFLMNIQEMASLNERDLDVKVIVLNNKRLGIVSQFQLITWGDDPTTGKFGVPDLVTISRGFGVAAELLERPADMEEKLEWLWAQPGPAMLSVIIDPDADIVPMLLAGQTMAEMWMGRDAK